jgi:pyruvate dehydrogenase E1 component alpha subunit|tara:strand:- start:1432 stop:1608 length:177 start_codon:yes stop_codon:yes gene_type:complete
MNKKIKIDLLKKMQLIRLVEETIAFKYSENKMRYPTHLYIGQEAIAAGVSCGLKKMIL